MKLIRKVFGYRSVNTDKVTITDPCYDSDVWCRLNNVPVKPGEYEFAYYTNVKDGRVFALEIQLKGKSFRYDSKEWRETGTIGVDGGMAGIFWNKPDFPDDEWEKFIRNFESNGGLDNKPLLDEYGFYSTSGYGDGSYYVYAVEESGENIAFKIEF